MLIHHQSEESLSALMESLFAPELMDPPEAVRWDEAAQVALAPHLSVPGRSIKPPKPEKLQILSLFVNASSADYWLTSPKSRVHFTIVQKNT